MHCSARWIVINCCHAQGESLGTLSACPMLPEGNSAGRGACHIKRRKNVLEAIVASHMRDAANPSHHDRPCSCLAY